MKKPNPQGAFTLTETMTALAASVIIISGLLVGTIGLHRSLRGSEIYASSYSDQRRLIDYVARDLRRAIGIAATDASGTPRQLTAGMIDISDRASLVLTLPGYYKSNVPTDADFDQPLPATATPTGPQYGTASNPAPPVTVIFRKLFIAEEGRVCFVRQEAAARRTIVRDAQDLHLRATVAEDGKTCALEAWFRSQFSGVRPVVSTFDRVMLRNVRSSSL